MLKLIPGHNGHGNPAVRALVLDEKCGGGRDAHPELERSGLKLLSKRVDSEKEFIHALRNFAPDVVLFPAGRSSSR